MDLTKGKHFPYFTGRTSVRVAFIHVKYYNASSNTVSNNLSLSWTCVILLQLCHMFSFQPWGLGGDKPIFSAEKGGQSDCVEYKI